MQVRRRGKCKKLGATKGFEPDFAAARLIAFWRMGSVSDPLPRVMTHKYRGCIVVLSINKSVEPNEEQKVLTSGFDQGFTVNGSKRVFRGIW
jgi:hypothetical protein